ncbi:PadR family transcriptional regulator [Nonomuraea jiangxiensis]|uniref:PadR family transcriptional regulator, regulatory protein PadR n=1 Tax=Nonomuraea jiangxiensis TaxID=633440 RepID=A0A1G8UIM9_9ACTN|nr:PadR family transcriptional regulator, regulatory protein PadR [Nonomuraea jiangxiensis]
MLQDAAGRGEATYGLEICKTTGLGPGTAYPILTRLERIGWVRAYWTEDDTRGPRRRMYELTGEGVSAIDHTQTAATMRRPGWAR